MPETENNRVYIAIDLKSFYASVECMERGLDPLTTNLVVADDTRTEKTICLAVSPSLKSYGISGRARLFEVVEQVRIVNAKRRYDNHGRPLKEASSDNRIVSSDPEVALGYVVAPPQMARYMEVSSQIYRIYLKYVAPEDIQVYSIDEVFIDGTDYLRTYRMTARELCMKMIQDVLHTTGITATAGIGTNLYLAKIAMDIVAKHIPADKDGVRIAELDEFSYREQLWSHRPLTDFWRVGKGYSKKLEQHGLYTMGDIARCSIGSETDYYNEDLLYKLFGVNAELLIDHAWGWEPCGMKEIKAYRPEERSISLGQVLKTPYVFEKGKLVVREMTDSLVLTLVDKQMVTDQMVLTVGYDVENLQDPEKRARYRGEIKHDPYGREIPKMAHGTINLNGYTSSTQKITEAVLELYDRIVDRDLTVRRMYVVANRIRDERLTEEKQISEQLDLFTNAETLEKEREEEKQRLKKERKQQETVLKIQKKFGKNAILKGMNFEEGATARERNGQIGGHKA